MGSRAMGAGGMGEVYRARDANLNRDVALKVLPASFAADADRVARFKREAQVLASLNHPNIAQIYGIEAGALVMELVEGEDLSTVIPAGGISLEDALAIARQIAGALEAAHEQGIVHRDLKPQNIKVREDGTVKVLDFGLARAMGAAGSDDSGRTDTANSPTLTGRATQMGMILGTAAYMSPEQARGKAVDRRADIWAFGVVLYEMLTGRRVFAGDEISDVLAAVLRQDIDFTALPAEVPPAIRRLLTRCLTRDPKQRLADASTIRLEIDEALQAPVFVPAMAPSPARPSWPLLAACGVLTLTSIVLAALHFSETPPASPPEMRLDIATPATPWGDQFEVSPDGLSLVFVAPGPKPGVPHLWVRRLDRPDALMLAGTEGGQWPFWSPDSRSIGFFAGGSVLRVDAAGGTPQDLGNTGAPFGGAWNAAGDILFRTNRGLHRVADTGGPTTTVIPGVSGLAPRFPQFLPDGRHFVYYTYTAGGPATGLYLASLDDPTPTKLGSTGSTARFIAPNLLLFVEQGKLVARAFDLTRREFIGESQTVAAGIGEVDAGHGAFSVSTGGLVVYRPQHAGKTTRLAWVDRTGTPVATPDEIKGSVSSIEISPDGMRLAVDRTVNDNRDVYLSDLALGGMTRLTFDAGVDGFPAWSRDNATIAFEVNRTGDFDIHARAASGAGGEQVWLKQPGHQWPHQFSIDSKFLLYYDSANDGDLMALPLSGTDRTPIPIAATPAVNEGQAVLSPDRRWVAYSTVGGEGAGVFVQAFPVPNGQWQVLARGHSPRWSAKGHELYFVFDDTMMAATVRASDTVFAFEPPVKLFAVRLAGRNARTAYVVDRQGRFLLNLAKDTIVSTPITALLNWRGGRAPSDARAP